MLFKIIGSAADISDVNMLGTINSLQLVTTDDLQGFPETDLNISDIRNSQEPFNELYGEILGILMANKSRLSHAQTQYLANVIVIAILHESLTLIYNIWHIKMSDSELTFKAGSFNVTDTGNVRGCTWHVSYKALLERFGFANLIDSPLRKVSAELRNLLSLPLSNSMRLFALGYGNSELQLHNGWRNDQNATWLQKVVSSAEVKRTPPFIFAGTTNPRVIKQLWKHPHH